MVTKFSFNGLGLTGKDGPGYGPMVAIAFIFTLFVTHLGRPLDSVELTTALFMWLAIGGIGAVRGAPLGFIVLGAGAGSFLVSIVPALSHPLYLRASACLFTGVMASVLVWKGFKLDKENFYPTCVLGILLSISSAF